MGTHPIFESDFDCLTDYFFRSFVKMIGRLAARRLSNLNGVKPTRFALRRNMDFAHAESSLVEDALLVGVWVVALGCYLRVPSSTSSFDYKGFQPKPKLFAAFQFLRL